MNTYFIHLHTDVIENDDVQIFSDLLTLDQIVGLWRDGDIYELSLEDEAAIEQKHEKCYLTKYSNIVLERKLSGRDIAQAGFIIVKDDNQRIVYYSNKHYNTFKTFIYN
jgi:hypothetical protein